jgi:hypothetical protein
MAEPVNPANKVAPASSAARKRIPMSTPQRRLEVPDIAGYRLYWFVERNVERALQGGYEFVDSKEIALNQRGIGTSSNVSGNSDMGSRVSVISGQGQDGQPERLVLLKIKQEWFEEDQAVLQARNKQIEDAIRRGQVGAEKSDALDWAQAYLKTVQMSSSKSPLSK